MDRWRRINLERGKRMDADKTEREITRVVRTADCCGNLDGFQYSSIDGRWHLFVLVKLREADGRTEWQVRSFQATHCHSCGQRLADLFSDQLRRHFPEVFPPLDNAIAAVREAHERPLVVETAPAPPEAPENV